MWSAQMRGECTTHQRIQYNATIITTDGSTESNSV
jgi:hypothetical protein